MVLGSVVVVDDRIEWVHPISSLAATCVGDPAGAYPSYPPAADKRASRPTHRSGSRRRRPGRPRSHLPKPTFANRIGDRRVVNRRQGSSTRPAPPPKARLSGTMHTFAPAWVTHRLHMSHPLATPRRGLGGGQRPSSTNRLSAVQRKDLQMQFDSARLNAWPPCAAPNLGRRGMREREYARPKIGGRQGVFGGSVRPTPCACEWCASYEYGPRRTA